MSVMHPRTAELLAYLDAQLEAVRSNFESVPVGDRGLRPSAEVWSAAEVVAHLALVERRLAALFRKLIAGARTSGISSESAATPILPTIDSSRIRDRTRKIDAPESVQPKEVDVTRVWTDFEAARAEVKEAISSGDGLAFGEMTASHPALGMMTMYEWIEFVGSHSARHAAQLRDIGDALRRKL